MFEQNNIQTTLSQCDNFISRPKINEKIAQALSKNKLICLIGQAGVGKSQIAYSYLRNQSEYKVILINCSSASNFINSVENRLGKSVNVQKQT